MSLLKLNKPHKNGNNKQEKAIKTTKMLRNFSTYFSNIDITFDSSKLSIIFIQIQNEDT